MVASRLLLAPCMHASINLESSNLPLFPTPFHPPKVTFQDSLILSCQPSLWRCQGSTRLCFIPSTLSSPPPRLSPTPPTPHTYTLLLLGLQPLRISPLTLASSHLGFRLSLLLAAAAKKHSDEEAAQFTRLSAIAQDSRALRKVIQAGLGEVSQALAAARDSVGSG